MERETANELGKFKFDSLGLECKTGTVEPSRKFSKSNNVAQLSL